MLWRRLVFTVARQHSGRRGACRSSGRVRCSPVSIVLKWSSRDWQQQSNCVEAKSANDAVLRGALLSSSRAPRTLTWRHCRTRGGGARPDRAMSASVDFYRHGVALCTEAVDAEEHQRFDEAFNL